MSSSSEHRPATRSVNPRHVVLADGSNASIRRLRSTDQPMVEALFASVTPEDLYMRFFALGPAIIARHIAALFAVGTRTIAYVVERDGRLLGIADVEPSGAHSAEIAFLVADGAHGLGIGTLLLELAAEDASERGVTTFVADVLSVNHPMIKVFSDAGFDMEMVHDNEGVTVQMSTRRTPAAAAGARHTSAMNHRSAGQITPDARCAAVECRPS